MRLTLGHPLTRPCHACRKWTATVGINDTHFLCVPCYLTGNTCASCPAPVAHDETYCNDCAADWALVAGQAS
jgi:hypothetical protein